MSTITELQNRLVSVEAAIAALTTEVSRLTGSKPSYASMRTSVPLRPVHSNQYVPVPMFQGNRFQKTYNRDQEAPENRVALSDLLQANEVVTIQVNTGKDASGNVTTTSALAAFDGTNLTITACELVPSLVGNSSIKPGELLYKFINELKEKGHISRTFTVPPWRLCSVVRDGKRQTLSELRAAKFQ